MPKEQIGGGRSDGSHVKVGWFPDRDVQIGVCLDGDRSIFWQLLGNHPKELGAHLRKVVTDHAELPNDGIADTQRGQAMLNALDLVGVGMPDTPSGDPPATMVFSSLWADLSRSECNKLIRILRRARDSAYGKDE